MNENTTQRSLAARAQHLAAQAQKRVLARQLRQLAAKLEDTGGICINEQRWKGEPRLRASPRCL